MAASPAVPGPNHLRQQQSLLPGMLSNDHSFIMDINKNNALRYHRHQGFHQLVRYTDFSRGLPRKVVSANAKMPPG
jgi:hypothetical protein